MLALASSGATISGAARGGGGGGTPPWTVSEHVVWRSQTVISSTNMHYSSQRSTAVPHRRWT